MKKIIALILILTFILCSSDVSAANTKSILLNGSNMYLSRADASTANLDIVSDMTIELWFRLDTLPAETGYNSDQTLVSKWSSSGERSYWIGYGADPSAVRSLFFHNADTAQNQAFTYHNITLTVDTWYFFAVAYDASAGSADYYLADEGDSSVTKVATKTGLRTSMRDSSTATQIGACSQQGQYYDGYIDEVRIYDDLRTEAELNANFKAELDSATNLQASWHLNDDLTDSSGNGYTLTNNNSSAYSTTIPDWSAGAPAVAEERRKANQPQFFIY